MRVGRREETERERERGIVVANLERFNRNSLAKEERDDARTRPRNLLLSVG